MGRWSWRRLLVYIIVLSNGVVPCILPCACGWFFWGGRPCPVLKSTWRRFSVPCLWIRPCQTFLGSVVPCLRTVTLWNRAVFGPLSLPVTRRYCMACRLLCACDERCWQSHATIYVHEIFRTAYSIYHFSFKSNSDGESCE